MTDPDLPIVPVPDNAGPPEPPPRREPRDANGNLQPRFPAVVRPDNAETLPTPDLVSQTIALDPPVRKPHHYLIAIATRDATPTADRNRATTADKLCDCDAPQRSTDMGQLTLINGDTVQAHWCDACGGIAVTP